jgi:hypothetical protein
LTSDPSRLAGARLAGDEHVDERSFETGEHSEQLAHHRRAADHSAIRAGRDLRTREVLAIGIEGDLHRSELDPRTEMQRDVPDALPKVERAVAAPEVSNADAFGHDPDLDVLSRHARILDDDVGALAGSEDARSFAQPMLARSAAHANENTERSRR